MNELAIQKQVVPQNNMILSSNYSIFLNVDRYNFAKTVASMLAASSMVPDQYRGPQGVGNCMIMLNLAERLNVDVFGLMQTSYVVHGRPGFEAKLVIALFNANTKLFTPPLRWEFKGDFPTGNDAGCRAYAKDKETGEIHYGEWIDWRLVKAEKWDSKQGSKWLTMPGQMFRYRSASFFINAYEPGLKMGIMTKDEIEDNVFDVIPMTNTKIDSDPTFAMPYDPHVIKLQEQFDALITEQKVAPARVKEFVDYAARYYKADIADIYSEALDKPDNFIKEFKAWEAQKYPAKQTMTGGTTAGDPGGSGGQQQTIADEIGNLRKTGLIAWEKANHDDIPHMSPEDKRFFADKWQRVVGFGYTAEGQPGFKLPEGGQKQEPKGNPGGEEEPPPPGDEDLTTGKKSGPAEKTEPTGSGQKEQTNGAQESLFGEPAPKIAPWDRTRLYNQYMDMLGAEVINNLVEKHNITSIQTDSDEMLGKFFDDCDKASKTPM